MDVTQQPEPKLSPKENLANKLNQHQNLLNYEERECDNFVAQSLAKVAENAIAILARNVDKISPAEAITIAFQFAEQFIMIADDKKDIFKKCLRLDKNFIDAKEALSKEIQYLENIVANEQTDNKTINLFPNKSTQQTETLTN